MSNILRKAKRTPLALATNKFNKEQKKIARYQKERQDLQNLNSATTIISNWCDDGATKPKCGHCPVCLDLIDGQKLVEITENDNIVSGQLNPKTFAIEPINA